MKWYKLKLRVSVLLKKMQTSKCSLQHINRNAHKSWVILNQIVIFNIHKPNICCAVGVKLLLMLLVSRMKRDFSIFMFHYALHPLRLLGKWLYTHTHVKCVLLLADNQIKWKFFLQVCAPRQQHEFLLPRYFFYSTVLYSSYRKVQQCHCHFFCSTSQRKLIFFARHMPAVIIILRTIAPGTFFAAFALMYILSPPKTTTSPHITAFLLVAFKYIFWKGF